MSHMESQWEWKGPVVDHHIHLDPKGEGLEAVKSFKSAGGTSMILVHKPNFQDLPETVDDYRSVYSDTINLAKSVWRNTGVKVGVILGPHPVAMDHQINSLGLENATELHLQAVEMALEFVQEREAIGLGEVGRPHYPISDERWNNANKTLVEVLKMANEYDAAVQLHVEENFSETYQSIDSIRKKAGLDKKHTVRHYASPNLSEAYRSGLPCTVNVGKGSISKIIQTWTEGSPPWGMETDFLDDPARPGAVLGPKTVPKRVNELCQTWHQSGRSTAGLDELLHRVNLDWIESAYGWSPL